jgi:hypothetical protein
MITNNTNADEAKILEIILRFVGEKYIEKITINHYEDNEKIFEVVTNTVGGSSYRDYITSDYELI